MRLNRLCKANRDTNNLLQFEKFMKERQYGRLSKSFKLIEMFTMLAKGDPVNRRARNPEYIDTVRLSAAPKSKKVSATTIPRVGSETVECSLYIENGFIKID